MTQTDHDLRGCTSGLSCQDQAHIPVCLDRAAEQQDSDECHNETGPCDRQEHIDSDAKRSFGVSDSQESYADRGFDRGQTDHINQYPNGEDFGRFHAHPCIMLRVHCANTDMSAVDG